MHGNKMNIIWRQLISHKFNVKCINTVLKQRCITTINTRQFFKRLNVHLRKLPIFQIWYRPNMTSSNFCKISRLRGYSKCWGPIFDDRTKFSFGQITNILGNFSKIWIKIIKIGEIIEKMWDKPQMFPKFFNFQKNCWTRGKQRNTYNIESL